MYISQGTYAAYFLWSFVGGILLGVLYDVFRIIRIASARESGGGLPGKVQNGLLKRCSVQNRCSDGRNNRKKRPAGSNSGKKSESAGTDAHVREQESAFLKKDKADGGAVQHGERDAEAAELTASGEIGKKEGVEKCKRQGAVAGSAYYDRLFCFLVFLEDILFFLVAACVMSLITYQLNYGRFRWFALAAACGGFAAYYFTVGRLVMLVSGTILLLLRKTVELIWRITAVPVAKAFSGCFGGLARILRRRAAVRRTARTEKRLLREAKEGFQTLRARDARRL